MGTWRLPSCTAIVMPTMSGMTVEARDQVRIMRFSPDCCSTATFFKSEASMYGPFFTDLDIHSHPKLQIGAGAVDSNHRRPAFRRRTINLSDDLDFRVR